jgi:translation initiation factor 5B
LGPVFLLGACLLIGMGQQTREPIIGVLGHVDHGKTSVLDFIRKTVVASREAGGITQHIGATDVPFEVIEKICCGLIDKSRIKIPLRGLLFIDTPGHAAFTNLRKRGGNVADLAILVVDINEGIMPQTKESLDILKQYKTPFIVVANKTDLIPGFRPKEPFAGQGPEFQREFQNRVYRLIGDLSMEGFDFDLYNNIQDFTKSVAVVPASAKTGEGIREALMMLIGLAQSFLCENLSVGLDSPAKGTILEVKETKGLGLTVDAIIYEGTLSVNDQIVVAAREPIVTRVKALLRPRPLDEMRDPKKQFKSVKSVYAASGVKIVAQNIGQAMPGGPVYVGGSELVPIIKKEIGEVEFSREEAGLIVRADTLGSLEALIRILESEGIVVKRGSIGKANKKDIIEAQSVGRENPELGAVMAFNTPILADARTLANDSNVSVFESDIIYRLVEDYQLWIQTEKERQRQILVKAALAPCKLKLMPDHVFRQSRPAIVGVEILAGTLYVGQRLMREKDGRVYGRVRGIQSSGESIQSAKRGAQVAVSIDDVTVGKQIIEGDTLYSFLSNEDVQRLNPEDLDDFERQTLRDMREIKRQR